MNTGDGRDTRHDLSVVRKTLVKLAHALNISLAELCNFGRRNFTCKSLVKISENGLKY